MASGRTDALVWLDLEMTGLDPSTERIIEIATVITDSNLRLIATGPELVIHQPRRILEAMDAWNQRQHRKSGLVEAVLVSRITIRQAERAVLQFLKRHCAPKAAPLCGNAVHHDRRFLIKYMPKIDGFLHYRHVDVSTIKELVRRWCPKLGRYRMKKDAHRAMSDILDSIQELRYYRRTVFCSKGVRALLQEAEKSLLRLEFQKLIQIDLFSYGVHLLRDSS